MLLGLLIPKKVKASLTWHLWGQKMPSAKMKVPSLFPWHFTKRCTLFLLPQALYVTYSWVFKEQGMSRFPCMSTGRSAEDRVYGPCGMSVCAQWREIPPLCSSCAAFHQLASGGTGTKDCNYLFAAPGFLELQLMSCHSLVS